MNTVLAFAVAFPWLAVLVLEFARRVEARAHREALERVLGFLLDQNRLLTVTATARQDPLAADRAASMAMAQAPRAPEDGRLPEIDYEPIMS